MTSTEPVWMTRQAYTRLGAELAALRSRPNIEVPEDFMDYDDNLVANYTARQARIHQIQDLLTNAVVGEDPPDDGIAEPGMVLTVRYDDTGEIETFLLGVRGAEDADIDVYSMQSPLGSAIVGARPGEQRTYSIPSGANLPVTLLKAVPYGLHTSKSPRRQSVPLQRTSSPGGDLWPRKQAATRHPATTSRRVALTPLSRPAASSDTDVQPGPSAHARCAIGRGERYTERPRPAPRCKPRRELICPLRHVCGSHRRLTSGSTGNWTLCAFCSPPESPTGIPTKTPPL